MMGSISRTAAAAPGPGSSIASPELEALLNTIDDARAHGSATYIDLPQIIVCGDQSSGKSSCLEAVCGLQFPVGDGLCTRFATEYVLRRAEDTSFQISIVPHSNRSEKEKTAIQRFKAPVDDLTKLSTIIDEAARVMGIGVNGKTFAHDVLRVELSGPDLPHLTLVDLPGLFHSSSESQSDEDKAAVFSLVGSYIRRPRCIILAVVSAKNDVNNQAVLNFAKKHDPQGARTLGIITKPDTLSKNSPSESMFLKLARNEDVKLTLGWHILRNRSFEEQKNKTVQRDLVEFGFFGSGVWANLSAESKGVKSLRRRLSKILENHILHELPGLIKDVNNAIQDCQLRIDAMGTERRTSEQQRQYLLRVSTQFTDLMRQAAEGRYHDAFFGAPSTEQEQKKRLAAIANGIVQKFAEDMRTKGHAAEIVDTAPASTAPAFFFGSSQSPRITTFGMTPATSTSSISAASAVPVADTANAPIFGVPPSDAPMRINKDDFYNTVIRRMQFNSGQNLPGLFDPSIIKDLSIEHLQPWRRLVGDANKKLLEAADASITMILQYCADSPTISSIRREVINRTMGIIRESVLSTSEQFLKPCYEDTPTTRNHYFTDNIQKNRKEEDKKQFIGVLKSIFPNANPESSVAVQRMYNGPIDTGVLLNMLLRKTEVDMERFAAIEAVNAMLSYYKVILKRFIDDFEIYVVKACLRSQLPTLFTPEIVIQLDEKTVERIAGESEESAVEREELRQKLEALKKTQQVLRDLSGNGVQ